MISRFSVSCCCGPPPPPPTRSLYFRVKMCGVESGSFTVSIAGVFPVTYTETRTSVVSFGVAYVQFTAIPEGEYTYTITRCSGHTTTGTTLPGVGSYPIVVEPPAGKIAGCCAEEYWFPTHITLSDGTGSVVASAVTSGLDTCCCASVTYRASKIITNFSPGFCWKPGPTQRGVCTPIPSIDLAVDYVVSCVCRDDGQLLFRASRSWGVVFSFEACDNLGLSVAQRVAICCVTTGPVFAPILTPITTGGSLTRDALEGLQDCDVIDFTVDVTDVPHEFEGGPYGVISGDCHPDLGDILTVTE